MKNMLLPVFLRLPGSAVPLTFCGETSLGEIKRQDLLFHLARFFKFSTQQL